MLKTITLILLNVTKVIEMSRNRLINYYKLHEEAFTEVNDAFNSVYSDYASESWRTISIVICNMISPKARSFYDVDFLEKVLKNGLSKTPIAVAIDITKIELAKTRASWEQLSFISKLVLGFKPTEKGCATLLLATHFNKQGLERLKTLSEFDQEVARFVRGNLYALTSY